MMEEEGGREEGGGSRRRSEGGGRREQEIDTEFPPEHRAVARKCSSADRSGNNPKAGC